MNRAGNGGPMRPWMKLAALGGGLFLIFAWTLLEGCRNVATPTFPGTATPAPTNTPAGSPVATNTPAITATPTITNTPGSGTNTATPTATVYTWTTENFNGLSSVPSGWSSNNNGGPATFVVPAVQFSSAEYYGTCSSGCQSLWIEVPFAAASQEANIQYAFTSNPSGYCTNLTGDTISLYYYLDAAPSSGAYGQMFIQGGAADSYDYQSYGFQGTYALTIGAWTQVSIPANEGGVNPSDIWQFGVQIGTGTGSNSGTDDSTVNFYIDEVSIQ